MKDLPPLVILEKNKLASNSAWLVLLDIVVNDDSSTILRFVKNNENISYKVLHPVGHWYLNDNLATTNVIDSSIGGNDGTAQQNTSVLSAAGKINTALTFNGTTDYITMGDISDLDMTGDMSFGGWFKSTASGATQYILAKRSTGLGNGYSLALASTGEAIAAVLDADSFASVESNSAINDGAWHFVMAVANRAGNLTMYVDGTLQDDTDSLSSETGDLSNSEPFLIGSKIITSGFFTGTIDNVMVFDKILDQADIDILYNSGDGTESLELIYTAMDFKLEPTSESISGEIAESTLQVQNVDRLLETYLRSTDGMVGSSVRITVVNSALLTADMIETELHFDIIASHVDAQWVTFSMGGPNPMTLEFLEKFMALICRYRGGSKRGFESAECGYSRKSIVGVTLSGTDPVSIEVTGHNASTGDDLTLYTVNGITGGIEGDYTITKTDANNFTLDGTDSSDYGGAYTSGGFSGFTDCQRRLQDCRIRENSTRFGGFVGLRSGGYRIA